MLFDYFQNRKVLVTGHTGFKGSWLCKILNHHQAEIYGYSLPNDKNSHLYNILGITNICNNECFADIRDYDKLSTFINTVKPDVIFHLAAQPLVRESYQSPLYTFQVNSIGTSNLLECLRNYDKKCAVICITTDKVYDNVESGVPFKETDKLGGYDPYSASKAAAEIIIDSYRKSFFNPKDYGKKHHVQLASVRAGNVIGGGDFSKDRIIVDIVNSIRNNKSIELRNPNSVRPWQHVLEPLHGYMTLAALMLQGFDEKYSSAFNFGPEEESFKSVQYLAEKAISILGDGDWADMSEANQPHEAGILKLDISKVKQQIGWIPKMSVDQALQKTFDWYKAWILGKDDQTLIDLTDKQIEEYEQMQ